KYSLQHRTLNAVVSRLPLLNIGIRFSNQLPTVERDEFLTLLNLRLDILINRGVALGCSTCATLARQNNGANGRRVAVVNRDIWDAFGLAWHGSVSLSVKIPRRRDSPSAIPSHFRH